MRARSIRLSRGARSSSLDPVIGAVLDATAAAIDAAVVVTDAERRVLMWNDGAEALYGWSAEEAMGSSIRDLVVPLAEHAHAEEAWRHLVDGDDWEGLFVCRRRDGSTLPVSLVNVPVVDDEGVLVAAIGVSRDLTERIVAERESTALAAMTEASSDAVFAVVDGMIASWSPAAERLLGWPAGDAVGLPLHEIVPPERYAEASALLERVQRGEAVEDFATERLARDRSRVAVRLDIAPVFDPAADVWTGLVTMHDDRSRDEILQAAVAAEARYRLLLASSTEIVLVVGPDGAVRAVSSSVQEMLGYSPAELMGTDPKALVHPDDLEAVRVALDEVRDHPELRPRVRYRRRRSDGTYRWGEATLSNRFDDPAIHGIVANVRDVDDLEQARARWAAVVSRSSDVGVFLTADGTIAWVSPAVVDVFGLDPEDVVGTNALTMVHEDDRAHVIVAFRRKLGRTGAHITIEFRMCLPDGRTVWVEEVATDLLDDPDVGYVVANLRDITERRASSEALARLALYDDLTGLPNRNSLIGMIQSVAAAPAGDGHRTQCGVIFFDLDDFCDVNDSFGHPAGDALLVAIARRITGELEVGCRLARFGGDQFAVLCPYTDDLARCLEVANKVRMAFSLPFAIDGQEVYAAVSLGVALGPAEDVDELLRDADTALYRAKRAGRGQTVVFERELAEQSLNRLTSVRDLRRAIDQREIVPWYQPVVDLATGRVVAVEALARWHREDFGFVPPDVFITLAESTGLIGELGSQLLAQTCDDAVSWLAAGTRLQLAVNASAVQLVDPGYAAEVAGHLERSGLPPQQLTLEITETAAMGDMERLLATLAALRRLHVDLSLDDFGTGYSSLSLLKRLPVTALKIDKSFVSGLGASADDEEIVQGVIGLANGLGFHVVGEGVETPSQARLLTALGCQFGQGYLWSPAVPADQVLAVIGRIEAATAR
ncbi:MAG: EAL domain-containing protein [Acidimicrobiales bacterium]